MERRSAKKVAEIIKDVCVRQLIYKKEYVIFWGFVMFVVYVSLFENCCNFFSLSK
jgi:hypothetical protein